MSANPEGMIERAMTRTADGNWCARPMETRAIAGRMMAWLDAPQPCQNCLSNQATRMLSGLALCIRCRDQRELRMEDLRRIDPPKDEWRGAVDDGDRVVTGYAIVTGPLSVDLGGFRERIMPEALNRTFREGSDLVYLWSHNPDLPMARLSERKMAIRKDEGGLMVRVSFPKSADAQLEAVQDQTVKGQSFGFRALQDEWLFDGDTPIRHVTDMRVSETSAVVFPAYEATTLTLASARGQRVDFLRKVHRSRMAR